MGTAMCQNQLEAAVGAHMYIPTGGRDAQMSNPSQPTKMDVSWAEKLQKYVDQPCVQGQKQCQETWTRLDMESSLLQYSHPDMFKILWGPILSRFLVTDDLNVRFSLLWLLFTLWKRHPTKP